MFDRKTNSFISKLASMKKQQEEIKGAQFIGKHSIISYKTFDPNTTYDYDFVISNSDTQRNFILTFTHSTPENQIEPTRRALAELNIFTRVDNSDVMADPIPYRTPTAPAVDTRWKKDMPPVDGQTSWHVRCNKNLPGITSFHLYMKWFVDGTTTGTFSIVEI